MSLKNELDRVLGPTPPAFSKRVDETLRTLKEDDKMKMAHMRRIVCVVVIAVVLLGAAVALIATQGQDWYYHSRFTGYQENEPEKQQAILDHLSTDIPQEQSDAGVASVVVQDASWAPENGVATLSLSVTPKDPDHDELYSLYHLDEDGSFSDTPDPEDPDSRTDHWLWTSKGHGLPAQTMQDPSKRLILLDDGDGSVYIGKEGSVALPLSSFDQFSGENADVICVKEFDLTRLDEQKVREQSDAQVYDSECGMTKDEWEADRAESLNAALQYAQTANAAISANTDASGMLTLRYSYQVIPFANNRLEIEEAVQGETTFQIKIR